MSNPNKPLAEDLVARLNFLLTESDPIRTDIRDLIETRILASEDTANHRSIQVLTMEETELPMLGFLGLLNGLIGVVPTETSYVIAAKFWENGSLRMFEVVEAPRKAP